MAVAFFRGQQLGKHDLNLFLTSASGTPINAAEISYSIVDFTTGQEVVVYRPASWKGQAPDDAKGRDDVRWGALPRADYDALVARVEKLRDEGFAMYAAYHAALKQRDEARALLREARGCVAVNYGPNEFSRLLARIDRCLEDKA